MNSLPIDLFNMLTVDLNLPNSVLLFTDIEYNNVRVIYSGNMIVVIFIKLFTI